MQIMYWLTSTFSTSLMSHLRANSLHVHLSLRLLHDHILQRNFRAPSNCNLRGNGHLLVRLRRVLIRGRLGSYQRQGGKEASPSCWVGRNSAQYAGIRLCSKFANCLTRAGPRRVAQRVSPFRLDSSIEVVAHVTFQEYGSHSNYSCRDCHRQEA